MDPLPFPPTGFLVEYAKGATSTPPESLSWVALAWFDEQEDALDWMNATAAEPHECAQGDTAYHLLARAGIKLGAPRGEVIFGMRNSG